jgi:serine O-acetyltransferase
MTADQNGQSGKGASVAPHSAKTAPKPPPEDLRGDRNQNPRDIGFWALLAEDFRTHDRDWLCPGFWAVAIHRFGNWRMDVKAKVFRAPLTLTYKVAHRSMAWAFGIDLPYVGKLGRRVRLGHHGSMHISARAIGNDVYIRHSATLGVLDPNQKLAKPTIGDRVEIGPGACVVGDITVGDDSIVGPNTVVAQDLPPRSVVLGNPARQVNLAELTKPRG